MGNNHRKPPKYDGANGEAGHPYWNQRELLDGVLIDHDEGRAGTGWPLHAVEPDGLLVAAEPPEATTLVMQHPLPAGAKTVRVRAFGTGLPPQGQLFAFPAAVTVTAP